MKFYDKFPFILLLVFCFLSCTKQSTELDGFKLNNSKKVKVKSYYKRAKKKNTNIKSNFIYLDSAIVLAKSEKWDTLYLQYMGYKSILFSKQRDYNKAVLHADSLLLEAIRLKDTFYIAKAYYKKGFYNSKLNKHVLSIQNYFHSKKYFTKLKDSSQIAGKLLNIAIIQKNIGDISAAKETLIEGLKYSSNSTNKKHTSNLYTILSIVKKEEGEYSKSLEYNEKAIQLLRNRVTVLSRKDSVSLIKQLNNKAVIYLKKEDYPTALELLDQVHTFPLINEKENLYIKALVLDNIGVAKGGLKNKAAESILLEAYQIRDSMNYKTGLNASLIHLCEFYIAKGKLNKALPMAELAYVNAQEIESLIAQKEALHYITELQIIPQQKYIKAYKKVTDSLTSLSHQVRNLYAEEKYEAHKNRILVIEKKKEAVAQRFLKRVFLLIGFVLVLLVLFYKYYSDKIKVAKNKKEQLETAYSTEIKISKRVHDELANDVYSVMTRLQTEEKLNDVVTDDIMDSLEIIYNKSRDISRETNSINTDNFTDTLKSMLSSYSNSNINVISKGLKDNFWNSVDNPKRIIVFRVLQELLTNMKKHSEATFVVLNFTRSKTEITINYSDNGIGMSTTSQNLKNGLKNAENRMNSINGEFTFGTELNKGVKIKMSFTV